MKYTSIFLAITILLFSILSFTSCVNTKKITYFNNIPNTMLSDTTIDIEPVIQKGDLLSISVTSLSPEVTTIFNASNTPATSSNVQSNTLAQAVGYLVSQEGYINFPMLGSIKAEGLRKEALKDLITLKLEDKKLLFDPIVTVR